MRRRRTAGTRGERGGATRPWHLALILLFGSLAVTFILFSLGLPFFFVFLFIPLIPFFGRKRSGKRCPVCGFETTDNRIAFCPLDGSRLEVPEGDHGE
jgi:hypothetical protein